MMHNPGIAERLAFGRPVDPVADPASVQVAQRARTALFGRLLIATILIAGGITKLTAPADTVAAMTAAGVPSAQTLVIVAAIAELAGGVALVCGFLTRLAALGLVVYLTIVTLVMHGFWSLEGAAARAQLVQFMKNLAIIGGILQVAAFGPSRYSIDRKIREPLQP